jgi:beta-glucosidase/6-phospho-beta-glucosidase/beta-galactosidase
MPTTFSNRSLLLDKFLEQKNIAENLDERTPEKIGDEVYEGYKRDLDNPKKHGTSK